MARYLKVKPAKLRKHGVESVQSRVVNLSELADITSDNIVPHLVNAFEKVYGKKANPVDFDEIICLAEVVELYNKYSSDEWLYGKWRSFTATRSGQFDWGCIDLSLTIDEERNVITDVNVATDALEVDLADNVRRLLVGASSVEAPDIPQAIFNSDRLRDIVSLIYN